MKRITGGVTGNRRKTLLPQKVERRWYEMKQTGIYYMWDQRVEDFISAASVSLIKCQNIQML